MTIAYPKADGDICYGEEANNISERVTNLESINQATKLVSDTGSTDKTYTWADSDMITDTTGYNDTIDTGNTDAVFYTDHYETESIAGNVTDVTGFADESNSSQTGYSGYKVTIGASDVRLTKVTKNANCTATHAYVYSDSAGSRDVLLGSGAFAGNDAVMKVSLWTGITYHIVIGSGESSYSSRIEESPGDYPNIKTNLTYISGSNNAGASDLNNGFNIESVITNVLTISNRNVQTEIKAFTSNINSIMVYANKVLNGASTMTVDVSSDAGSNFEVSTGALNEFLTLDGDDTDIVLKFNLGVVGSSGAELYGYSYQVY